MLCFKLWLEEQEKDIEKLVFSAIDDPRISQNQFDQLIKKWIETSKSYAQNDEIIKRPYKEPNSTTFLSGQHTKSLAKASKDRIEEHGFSGIGLITQPLTTQYLSTPYIKNYDSMGIDNGMFTLAGQKNFSWDKYEKMIKIALAQEKRGALRQLNFFTVPDQPFDWVGTMKKFEMYRPQVEKLRQMGAPVAIVLQNGAAIDNIPWNDVDVLFIGGDTNWKTGKEAKEITKEAQKRHKTIHMGRVNSNSRINVASDWNVETADGTYLMHKLAHTLHEIEKENPQQPDESNNNYWLRLKNILYKNHEPKIVRNFVASIADNQKNNYIWRRYAAIAQLIKGWPHNGQSKINKKALIQYDHFLPQVPGMPHDEDVIEFDNQSNVLLDKNGMPIKNQRLFQSYNYVLPWEKTPKEIPSDPKNLSVYSNYINKYIMKWRNRGVLPR